MTNSHTADSGNPVNGNRSGELGQNDSLLSSWFDKDKHQSNESKAKDGKGNEDKSKQEAKRQEDQQKDSKQKEEKLAQEAQRLADLAIAHTIYKQQEILDTNRSALNTSRSAIKALIASIGTGLKSVNEQDIPQIPQEKSVAVPKIAELGKAPPEIHKAFAAQLASEVVAWETVAKVNSWRAPSGFNGTDALSTPKDGRTPDERLANLGRPLVEMHHLVNYNKPINDMPQTEWLSNLKSVIDKTNKDEVVPVRHGQIIQQIIDRKVETLHLILNTPSLRDQMRGIKNGDDKALTTFLAKVEAQRFPVPIKIEGLERQLAMSASKLNADIEQKANKDFPADDSISAAGKQASKALSYLDARKIEEAKASLVLDKSNPLSGWLTLDPKLSIRDQQIALNDRLTVLKEVTKVPAGQSVPVAMISPKFLDLMLESVSSSKAKTIPPIEVEASRQAVLYACQNPNTFELVTKGLPDDQIKSVMQEQLTGFASRLAEGLFNQEGPYKGKEFNDQIIADKIREITFPAQAIEVMPAPSPSLDMSAIKLNDTSATIAQKQEDVLPVVEIDNNSNKIQIREYLEAAGLANKENMVVGNTPVEPLATAAPLAVPQFSMTALNDLMGRVAHIGEALARSKGINLAALGKSSGDFLRQTSALMSVSLIDNMGDNYIFANKNLTESVIPAATNSPIGGNYDSSLAYHTINLPTPIEASFQASPQIIIPETPLTGKGVDLDGANRGPNSGGSSVTRNSAIPRSSAMLARSTWSPSAAINNWTANNGGAVLSSNSNSSSNADSSKVVRGPSYASQSSNSSGGGGGGFALAFFSDKFHGLLNGMRGGGGWAYDGANPFNMRNREKEQDQNDDKDDNSSDDSTQTALV